jgi:predicted N-formylglutamate amidohydrolase
MTRSPARKVELVLTCEHAGNRIPRAYAGLFRGAGKVLASHRGWDPGALPLARVMSKRLCRPLLAVTWSRLLVEANRAPNNRRIWSSFTQHLPQQERQDILAHYWRPHRESVERAVAAVVGRGRRAVHVAVHSFTPKLDGEVRNADVSFLYDSRRRSEAALCRRWAAILAHRLPELRVRRNYPYRGSSDGLTTWLRRQHGDARYAGIELEINQALVGKKGWSRLQTTLADSLDELLGGATAPAAPAPSC